MNKFDSGKLRTKFDSASEGWLVQVYSNDRRLVCVLDASHARTFLLGLGLGLLVAVGWVNLVRYRHGLSPDSTPPTGRQTFPEMRID